MSEPTKILGKCREGEDVFFDELTHPTVPGQIYSQSGLRELSISGYCEHHFDEISRDLEDQ